eukprot:56783-Rhodomonas_salina.2
MSGAVGSGVRRRVHRVHLWEQREEEGEGDVAAFGRRYQVPDFLRRQGAHDAVDDRGRKLRACLCNGQGVGVQAAPGVRKVFAADADHARHAAVAVRAHVLPVRRLEGNKSVFSLGKLHVG